MQRSPHRLTRFVATTALAGTLTLSGLVGLASTADAKERIRQPDMRHSEPATFVLAERDGDERGFTADATKDTGDQQFCDGTPVPDDIVECDIDEIAWTCVNGDTDPTDGGCIGNVDKPSVFPQD